MFSTQTADFEGTSSGYDYVPGQASAGWSTGWTTQTNSNGTMHATILSSSPGMLNGSSNYMATDFFGTSSFYAGSVSRSYASGTNTTSTHEIQFDYSYGSPTSTFTSGTDIVSIFGNTSANYVMSANDTWEVFAQGNGTNTPTWKLRDGVRDANNLYNPNNILDTGMAAKAGDIYRINLFLFPGNSNYLAEITDKSTGAHWESADRLGFRNVPATTTPPTSPTASSVINFGSRVSDYNEEQKFHVDQVSVGRMPAFVTQVTAKPNGSSSITLNWNNNGSANVDHYVVERSTDGNFATGITTLTSSLAASSSTYTDTGLTASTLYFYRVTAVSTLTGTGSLAQTSVRGYSGAVNTLTAGLTLPFLHAQTVSPNQINLIWPDADGETSYTIDYSSDAFSTIAGSFTLGSDTNTKWVTGLTPNTQYSFRIKASNGSGSSGFTTAQAQTSSGVFSSYPVAAAGSDPLGDSHAIQYAIDNAPNGSTITFASGSQTYDLTSTILVPSNKKLTFQGSTSISSNASGSSTVTDQTIIDASGTPNKIAFQYAVTNAVTNGLFNARFTGLTFQGGEGILFNDAPNDAIRGGIIDGCHFIDSAGNGIETINGLVDTVIQNNVFDDSDGFGIYGYGQSSDNIQWQFLQIANNLFRGTGPGMHIGGDAQASWNSQYLVVEQNHVTGCAFKGYELQGAGSHAIIQDNYFDNPVFTAGAPADRLAMTVPLDGVDATIIRRNKLVVPNNGQVNLLLELGGHNLHVYDNYLSGGNDAIAVNGLNPVTTGVIENNQIVDSAQTITSNATQQTTQSNNTSTTVLDWDIDRDIPGPGYRILD